MLKMKNSSCSRERICLSHSIEMMLCRLVCYILIRKQLIFLRKKKKFFAWIILATRCSKTSWIRLSLFYLCLAYPVLRMLRNVRKSSKVTSWSSTVTSFSLSISNLKPFWSNASIIDVTINQIANLNLC